MVEKKILLEKFEITGSGNISDEVLKKCLELCELCGKDEEEFVDMWVDYSINHLDGNLNPTLEALYAIEQIISVTSKERISGTSTVDFAETEHSKSPCKSVNETWHDNDYILGAYATGETLSLLTKRAKSPDREDNVEEYKASQVECTTPRTPSAKTQQPYVPSQPGTPWSKGSDGKVLVSFGPKVASWANSRPQKFTVKRAGAHVPQNARHMFELLKTTSDVRTRICRAIGGYMAALWAEKSKDDVPITWNVRTRIQKKYRTWGRICWESEVKLPNSAILLEGCRKPPNLNKNARPEVELDLGELRECCLFPGQILAIEGINLTENVLKVSQIFTDSFIPSAKPARLTEALKVMLAAGPFTSSSDLNYEPLWDLMKRVAEDEPHLLILIGPFLDHAHPNVVDEKITCTYQELFNRTISKVMEYVAGKCTQVILIASHRDAHHYSVYPTPEYNLYRDLQKNPNLHSLPDPCTLDIDGLRIGITSVDSLMHLGREEVTVKPSSVDKLSRLGNHILNQACFYPLYPPAKEINLDSELWEKYAFLQEKPHILCLPSDMRYFCKLINDSVILNPERLSKRAFARLNIKSAINGKWSIDNISCEIIKV